MGVELIFGKKSLVVVCDENTPLFDRRFGFAFVKLFNDKDEYIGALEFTLEGYEFLRSGGKPKTKSVSQFKKEIK